MTGFCTLAALRWAVLAISLVVLPGCSMMRLGYGYLDTYAAWKANEYFDLESHQKDDFQRRFDRLHEWHRYQELPDYAAFLAKARQRLDKSIEPQDVDWFVDGVKERYARIVSRATDDAVVLLYTLMPAQLEVLKLEGCNEAQGFLLGRPGAIDWDDALEVGIRAQGSPPLPLGERSTCLRVG